MAKNRKKELLDLAYRLFIEKGYDNVSVDEIIAKANIAKGTFYYYFKSKDEMLDQVVGDMTKRTVAAAEKYLDEPVPVEEKFISIITSLTKKDNKTIEALNNDNNLKMCAKYSEQIVTDAVSLLKKVVTEGNKKAIFHCNHVEERIKIILILSCKLFEDQNNTPNDTEVFIDILEKTLGIKNGTMDFAKDSLNR